MKGCALDINQELYAAIKCRIRWISHVFVWRHSPSMREKGLQPIQRVAIILATRFHPFPGEECDGRGLLYWYMDFCDEIERALKAMQKAIASGELEARSSVSRLPVEPATWLQTDISASMRASFANLLNDGPPTGGGCASLYDRPWPDEAGKPDFFQPDVFHLAVDERELIEWLAAKRIATMSEAELLFSSDGVATDEKTQASDNRGRPATKKQTEIDAVLASLARNRFDPLALPVGKGKQAGAKQAVWQDVGKMFASRAAFNSRWRQMKEDGFIADA